MADQLEPCRRGAAAATAASSILKPSRRCRSSSTSLPSGRLGIRTATNGIASAMALCVLMVTLSTATAAPQIIGKDICACSPPTFEFTFNFDLTCPRPGGDYGPGVAEVTCFVTSFSADVLDLKPVSVQTISIIEANFDRIPIAQLGIDGEYENGDSFTYSSISALGGNSTQIPQSIQLTITGTNAVNASLVQVWAIKYTNDCKVYPVLEVGGSFGWTEFTRLGTPRQEVCPVAPLGPTMAPTMEEINNILPPATEPTPAPSVVVVVVDTEMPTEGAVVTAKPTIQAVENPTANEVEKTVAPTVSLPKKTLAPTVMKGGKDQTTQAPAAPPSLLPTINPLPPAPPTNDLVEETAPPSSFMSMSYQLAFNDEDLDYVAEFGLEKKKKKERSTFNRHGLVRTGGRRRRKN